MNKKIAAIVLALSLGGCANVDMSREEMVAELKSLMPELTATD